MRAHISEKHMAKINAARASQEDDGVGSDIMEVFQESIQMQKTINSRLQQQSKVSDEVSARLQAVEQIVVSGSYGSGGGGNFTPQSIASRAIHEMQENNAYGALKDWNEGTARIKMHAGIRAALVNESSVTSDDTGIPSQPARHGMVIPAQRALRLLDVLPSRPVTADSVEFIQLSSAGNSAVQEREGDTKAEIEVDGRLKRVEIVTIAGHTTASRQVLRDHVALQSCINKMIHHNLLSTFEHQIINGDGSFGNIHGLVGQATPFTPTIGVTPADIIGEALMRQSDNGYQPNLIVMNPVDWFRIQVTRKAVGEEEYVFGSPTMPLSPALWSASVVTTPSIAEGKALTVDTSFTTVLDREEPSILLSNSHEDYFIRNLVSILGELRVGLEVLDTAATYLVDLQTSGA